MSYFCIIVTDMSEMSDLRSKCQFFKADVCVCDRLGEFSSPGSAVKEVYLKKKIIYNFFLKKQCFIGIHRAHSPCRMLIHLTLSLTLSQALTLNQI